MRMKKIYLARLGNRVRLIFILFACGQVGQQQEVSQDGEGTEGEREGEGLLSCRYVREDKRKLHLMSADSQKRYKRDRQILRQLAGLIICNRLMPPAYGHRVRQNDRLADWQTERQTGSRQLVSWSDRPRPLRTNKGPSNSPARQFVVWHTK